MKKLLSILIVCAIITCSFSTVALAANSTEDDANFTQNEFELLEHIYAEYELNTNIRATGLITDNRLGIAKSGAVLKISGFTQGSSDVIKCGFSEVIIQRRVNSSSSWMNYKTYKDLYSESTRYDLSKSLTIESGYQYRVTATHYAKKSLFSTQKIEVTTGYLTF